MVIASERHFRLMSSFASGAPGELNAAPVEASVNEPSATDKPAAEAVASSEGTSSMIIQKSVQILTNNRRCSSSSNRSSIRTRSFNQNGKQARSEQGGQANHKDC